MSELKDILTKSKTITKDLKQEMIGLTNDNNALPSSEIFDEDEGA